MKRSGYRNYDQSKAPFQAYAADYPDLIDDLDVDYLEAAIPEGDDDDDTGDHDDTPDTPADAAGEKEGCGCSVPDTTAPLWGAGFLSLTLLRGERRACSYRGVLAARHHLRLPIIERSPHAELNIEQLALFDVKAGLHSRAIHSDVPPTPKRIGWRRLLARVFSVDLRRCPVCEGPLKIIEAVVDPGSHRRVA
ncbi:MAG: hypothetical protein V3V08_08090 [Nannocystaceae bacterium]